MTLTILLCGLKYPQYSNCFFFFDTLTTMEKKDFILDASMKMVLAIINEWDDGEGIVDLAKDCANAAEKIWDKANLQI